MSGELPIAALAARWSELLIADLEPGERLTAAAAASGSLLRRPASEDLIRRAEERLGWRLPPSYREFLLVSDGAYGDDYGPTIVFEEDQGYEQAPSESDVVGVGFLPVSDVRWLREADPGYAQILANSGEDAPVEVDGEEPEGWAAIARGLLIATQKGPGTTVLIPFDGLPEWQLWNVHKETSVAYRSFRSFLEDQVSRREPVRGSLAEIEDLIARAIAGDRGCTMRLSQVTEPAAVPLLEGVVGHPGLGIQPALGLASIGTPEAMDALLRLDPLAARQALIGSGTAQARDVLAERGDYRALFDLRDPRGFEMAAEWVRHAEPGVGRTELMLAVAIVGLSGDSRYVPTLLPLLEHPEPEVQYSAACQLARLGVAEGERRLEEFASTPTFTHHSAAGAVLAKIRRRREGG